MLVASSRRGNDDVTKRFVENISEIRDDEEFLFFEYSDEYNKFLSMNHSSSIYLVIHLRHVTEKISGILCYVICTKYRYLLLFMEHLRRGEEETLFQPTFYAVWIRVSRGFSNFCLRSRILCTLYVRCTSLLLNSSKRYLVKMDDDR